MSRSPARPRRGVLGLAVALLAILIVGTSCGRSESGGAGESDDSTASAADARNPAPEFVLEQVGGGQVSLVSLRGKTVIVDFWATWCPPCEFQVPGLNAFFDAHRDDADVAVYGVSVDSDGAELVEAWLQEKEVRYPVLLAGGDDLARRYGAVGFPTLVVIDPTGAIESLHVGVIELADLEEALARIRDAG